MRGDRGHDGRVGVARCARCWGSGLRPIVGLGAPAPRGGTPQPPPRHIRTRLRWMPPAAAFAVVALVLLAVAGQWLLRRNRQQRLAAIRASWGKPSARPRRMKAIAEYHRSILLASGAGGALDDRTWTDLNLDEVFQAIDRTESTLGQQMLYHRLRQQNTGDLDAFEQLVERMSSDVATREQIQLVLAALRDPDGYDLWWLAQAEALTRPRWHLLFVAWAVLVLAAAIVIPFWPTAVLIPVAGAAINLAIRTKTVWRVSSMIGPFRQVSALVSAAEVVRRAALPGPVADSLAEELPKLERLTAIARWVGRDPSRSNEVVAAFWEYLNLLLLLDINVLSYAVGELRTSGGALLKVIAAVGQVDAAIGVASLRAGTRLGCDLNFSHRGSSRDWPDSDIRCSPIRCRMTLGSVHPTVCW